MRKSKQAAAATREKIVETASREFRKNGIVATGLADLMSQAGLTRGGFYKHFESKDQLVAETTALALGSVIAQMKANVSEARDGIGTILDNYLSEKHRDNRQDGCALSAIGSEFARCDIGTREVATSGFLRMVEIVEGQFKGVSKTEARNRALFSVSAMIGAVTMSRVVTDRELSRKILRVVKGSLERKLC
jgi:TetR/AcrR family transcriptional regulator, transcriptional repressor for nem operon